MSERLFWRDGECFLGTFNDEMTEIRNLKVVRLGQDGKVIAIDAGLGLVKPGAVWDANTLSVESDFHKDFHGDFSSETRQSSGKIIPFQKILAK